MALAWKYDFSSMLWDWSLHWPRGFIEGNGEGHEGTTAIPMPSLLNNKVTWGNQRWNVGLNLYKHAGIIPRNSKAIAVSRSGEEGA
jgi:hypothetical protein